MLGLGQLTWQRDKALQETAVRLVECAAVAEIATAAEGFVCCCAESYSGAHSDVNPLLSCSSSVSSHDGHVVHGGPVQHDLQ